ncbi:hypothetical protein OIE66_40480 [Nonomuraea sp. NBC_01738]|uniref:hypothetical protein n=1 Tax=Nonomuraea sp. NBC_01738 TaxID=2976003 RepID=UPI002E0D1BA4|nr:hypothetical protein OIE66_40480 [Nonomuraea sp. NBC_01738]
MTTPAPARRSRIEYADELFGVGTLEAYLDWLDAHRDQLGVPYVPRPVGDAPEQATAWARVDHARWIADCPWRCGASHATPRNETRFWCTGCANGGTGKTCRLQWPVERARVELNMSTLPTTLASWPCAEDLGRYAAGEYAAMCEPDRRIGAL